MNLFAICLLLIGVFSCCKAIVESKTYLENKTTSKILIKAYKDNKLVAEGLLEIEKSATIDISAQSYVAPNALSDSILIIFDNDKKITHYSKDISNTGKNTNALKYNDPRNLFNGKGFVEVRKALDCGGSFTTYTYTFTEEDYLNAK